MVIEISARPSADVEFEVDEMSVATVDPKEAISRAAVELTNGGLGGDGVKSAIVVEDSDVSDVKSPGFTSKVTVALARVSLRLVISFDVEESSVNCEELSLMKDAVVEVWVRLEVAASIVEASSRLVISFDLEETSGGVLELLLLGDAAVEVWLPGEVAISIAEVTSKLETSNEVEETSFGVVEPSLLEDTVEV